MPIRRGNRTFACCTRVKDRRRLRVRCYLLLQLLLLLLLHKRRKAMPCISPRVCARVRVCLHGCACSCLRVSDAHLRC